MEEESSYFTAISKRVWTDYETLYGYAHGVVKTKKQKNEADNNRRSAACLLYTSIAMQMEEFVTDVEIQKQQKKLNQVYDTYTDVYKRQLSHRMKLMQC